MALSMNSTNNRKEERINLLFSLLNVHDNKDKELIPNIITTINTKISNDFIAGVIDGDGSFFYFFQ